MKEFKGTQGPWHVSDEGCVVIRDDEFFGHVASNIGYPSDEEDMANANLIASSPELLSGLQQLLEIYDDHSGKVWTTSSKRRALDNARAAVNKALGETK